MIAENLQLIPEGHCSETFEDIKKTAKDLAEQYPDKEICIFQYLGSYKQQAIWTPVATLELVDHGAEASIPKNEKSPSNFYIDENAEKVVDGLVARKLAGAETKPLKKDE